jgi:FkbM family methyltransferase
MVQISSTQKIHTIFKTVKNLYMIPIDKAGIKEFVSYNFRNGTTLKCRCKSTDINEAVVVHSGLEYPAEPCLFSGRSDSRPIVIMDLGGNIGAFSTWVKALNPEVGIHLHVFEPHPGNISVLRDNLNKNDLQDAQIHEVAVAGISGTVDLDVSTGFDAFSIARTSSNMMTIKALSVRDFLAQHGLSRVDLLKMDIEGAEFEIIANDLEVIAATVSRLVVEFHGAPDCRRVTEMLEALKSYYDLSMFQSHGGGGVVTCWAKKGATSEIAAPPC